MKIKDIPKFVINLDRRQDRLVDFDREMRYVGWNYERFSAVDTNSYIGCAQSHQQLARIILDRQYSYAIVMEDDICFMPYAQSLIDKLDNILFKNDISWDIIHFAPSIHRPLNRLNDYLLDLTHLPPKDESKHRGIYGTSGFILTSKACEYIVEWDTDKFLFNSHRQIPIDQYLDTIVYPNIASACPNLPIFVQRDSLSDINHTYDHNHYLMTYNWNEYCPSKLPEQMLSAAYCESLKRYEH